MSEPEFPSDAQVRWSGSTHPGRFRSNNEDAFLALAVDAREVRRLGKWGDAPLGEVDYMFAVSDGMGGARAGEFASHIAVDRLTWLMPRVFRQAASGMKTGFSDIFLDLFGDIHADIVRLGRSYEECSGMGATLTLVWLTPGWLYFAHIGDSRLYYLPKYGQLAQATHDHSHVGWLRRKGEINERQAREHPRRHMLQQSLGAGTQFIEPQFGAIGYQPGDRFLLCSDGLVDGLWDRQIEEILRISKPDQADGAAHALVTAAVDQSGQDNTTAVVFTVDPTTGQ